MLLSIYYFPHKSLNYQAASATSVSKTRVLSAFNNSKRKPVPVAGAVEIDVNGRIAWSKNPP